MGISQGLDSGAINSSTEEIRVIELSINNETHRKAAPVLMGFTLVLVPPWSSSAFSALPGKCRDTSVSERELPAGRGGTHGDKILQIGAVSSLKETDFLGS